MQGLDILSTLSSYQLKTFSQGRGNPGRPVLCLRNTELLVSWYDQLVAAAAGDSDTAPPAPPPEVEVFKSESYANFIYLFFKIGTEVNVFSHLGKVLFTQMKERGGATCYLFFRGFSVSRAATNVT
jgi:hypothetical protein